MSVRRSVLEGSEAARSVADVGCDGFSGGKIGGGPKQSPVLLFDDDGDAVGKVRGASPFANGAKTTDTTAGGSTLDAASQPSTETVGSFEIRETPPAAEKTASSPNPLVGESRRQTIKCRRVSIPCLVLDASPRKGSG
jgi:hypothetical protein